MTIRNFSYLAAMRKDLYLRKSTGGLIMAGAYIIALFIAVAVGNMFKSYPPLVEIAVADLAATVTIWIFSLIFNNSSMYDPYWSVKPAVIAMYYLWNFYPGAVPARQIIMVSLILLYSIRLTSNFYRDWPGLKHEDWRYVNYRRQFPKLYWLISFFGIHFFPTVMVYLGCIPMYAVMLSGTKELNWVDITGSIVLLSTIILAFIADEQLRNFRKVLDNKGKFITTGFWKCSRHPNYFGEIMTWWGLLIFGLASGIYSWWIFIGAVAITLLFIFISIPLMEKKIMASRPGYDDYRIRTSMLIPWGFK